MRIPSLVVHFHAGYLLKVETTAHVKVQINIDKYKWQFSYLTEIYG